MTNDIKMGSDETNNIVISKKHANDFHCQIIYEKGEYYITPISYAKTKLNGKPVEQKTRLEKTDKIGIGNTIIHWRDYYFEGETQEISLSQLFDYHGRISRSNFRALSLLLIGVAVCIFFLPGLAITIIDARYGIYDGDLTKPIRKLAIPLYFIGYGGLLYFTSTLTIQRIRDAGEPLWKGLLPIYNLKLLYLTESKVY